MISLHLALHKGLTATRRWAHCHHGFADEEAEDEKGILCPTASMSETRILMEWSRTSSFQLWAELLSVKGLSARFISILTSYSYGSNFIKINDASFVKSHNIKLSR